MGATLNTPSVCAVCHELLRDPVVLKCNHRYCQRCLTDLWSISPSGPYRCPEWRCTAVYQTLPFAARRATAYPSPPPPPPPPSASASASASSGQGTSYYNDAFGGDLPNPLFTNRLGKRKASAPVDQQPDVKRPSLASQHAAATEPSETAPFAPAHDQVQLPTTSSASSDEEDGKSSTRIDESAEEDEVAPLTTTNSTASPELILEDSSSSKSSSSDGETFCTEVDLCVEEAVAPGTRLLSRGKPPPAGSPTASGTPSTDKPSPRLLSWPSASFSNRPILIPTSRLSPSAGASPPQTNTNTTSSPTTKVLISMINTSHLVPVPVPCHYCASPGQQLAVKTCLVCGASMCAEHLRPHLDSPVFRSHTLVAPIEDLSAWRCPEHQELSRIYCRQCALCVCTVCTVIGSHRDHACISIREAERELRGNLKEEIQQLQLSEHTLTDRLAELKQKKLEFQGVLEDARAAVQQQYEAMREALEQEERSALQCVVQEESRTIGGLESHLGRLQGSLTCIQQGLHTLEGLADAKGEQRVQEQAFIMEYSKITQMFSDVGPCVVDLDVPEEVDRARLNCLRRWTEKRLNTLVITLPERDPYRLLYGTFPSLDADTAHPRLLLSDNNRRVTYGEAQQTYPEQGARFSSFPQVLASKAMDQGCWYWEVEVTLEDAGHWKVGLCEPQIGRKGQKGSCRLGHNPYSWCLGAERGKVEAMHDKVSVPVATERLRRIGVFLDCDEGVLSFYSVAPGGALALLHTYKQRFEEPVYPAFSVCKAQLTICDLFKVSSPE